MPDLNPQQFRQPSIPGLDPGPERDDTTYFHFAPEGLQEGVDKPLHIGTGQAAVDRARSSSRWTPENTGRLPGRVYAGRIRTPMMNTPDTQVSDEFANVMSKPPDEQGETPAAKYAYQDHYTEEGDSVELLAQFGHIKAQSPEVADWAERNRQNLRQHGGGLYYKNMVEDPGSTSAVLPSASHFEVEHDLRYSADEYAHGMTVTPEERKWARQYHRAGQEPLPGMKHQLGGVPRPEWD